MIDKLKKLLQDWLEVPKAAPKQEVTKELRETISKLESELSFWKTWFRRRQPTKKCTRCTQSITLWPFNGNTSYYVSGSRVRHQTCPEVKS